MNLITIILISLGLSMDCFAVAVTSGAKEKKQSIFNVLKASTSFGLFQAFMPILGWTLGNGFRGFISAVDHWIAFLLLATIGVKMIYEALKGDKDSNIDLLSSRVLLALSVATSIDALIVGMSLAFIDVNVAFPSMIIGIVAFVITFLGFYAGKSLNFLFKNKIEIIGGFVLIGIGIKVLIEHLT